MKLSEIILEWSEVWALLIPLTIMILYKPLRAEMRPLFFYVCIGLVLNSVSTTSFYFHKSMPVWLKNNNIYYNLHSITRVIFFGLYIYRVTPNKNRLVYTTLFSVYGIFVLINFVFIKSIFFFSTWLFAAESIILIVACINFYLQTMKDESKTEWMKQPFFLVCTGVILYEAITFFIFLFIIPMANINPRFGLLSLKIYKITFVLLCILIALTIYKSQKNQVWKAGRK